MLMGLLCWQPVERRRRIDVRAMWPEEPPKPPSLSPYILASNNPMKSYKSGLFSPQEGHYSLY